MLRDSGAIIDMVPWRKVHGAIDSPWRERHASFMATDAVWIESYLDRHANLVAFDCESRSPRTVALELADNLGVSYRAVHSAMRERMYFVPAALDLLEAV